MKKKRLLTDRSGGLQEEIISEKAYAIALDIDAKVLQHLYQELGWHEVVLSPMAWEEGYEIDSWVESNIKKGRWTYGLVWMFENDKDAMWFKLRWLNGQ